MSGDRIVKWKAPRHFWNAARADDILGTAGADTGQNAGGPVVAVAGDGSGLAVVQIGAQNDEVSFFRPIPHWWDRSSKVLARVWFFHSSTGSDNPVFTVKTKFHAKQAAVADFDTADDASVVFTAHAVSTTAGSLEVTDWYDLEWDQHIVDTDIAVGLILACTDLGSASANEIELYGIQFMLEAEYMTTRRETTANMLLEQPL